MFTAAAPEETDVRRCADALAASVVTVRRAEAERFQQVAAWADVHPPAPGVLVVARYAPLAGDASPDLDQPQAVDPRTVRGGAGGERAVRLGADGTPAVAEYAAVELGMLLQTSTVSAAALLRDALEVRHRLPSLWAAVMAGEVEVWQARKAATLTRVLSAEACARVEERVTEALSGLSFGRAVTVVEGLVLAADPEGHEQRRRAAEAARYVSVGRRTCADGLATLVAQTTAADVARIDDAVGRIAGILAARGDEDTLQVRRATALGVLADPAAACLLLAGAGPEARDDGLLDGPLDAAARMGEVLRAQGRRALRTLRPRTVLYVHLAEEALTGAPDCGVARVDGLGPVGLRQLEEWLGADRVTVRPVRDLAGQVPVDAYEVPGGLAETMALRHPYEVFPWGTTPTRRCDLDHTVPYDETGPPGQTSADNLGPLGRHHHRAKTVGGFTCHQPLPGVYLWRTPSGHWFQVDHTGTTALGRGTPAMLRPPPRVDTVAERRFRVLLDAA